MVDFLSTDWVRIPLRLLHSDRRLMGSIIDRRCAAVFGVKTKLCVFIWLYYGGRVPQGTKPKHLLWGLAFLKLYEVEEAFCTRVQADEKTCRKWITVIVCALSDFNLVSLKIFILECTDLFIR